jgi:hypothetical protein
MAVALILEVKRSKRCFIDDVSKPLFPLLQSADDRLPLPLEAGLLPAKRARGARALNTILGSVRGRHNENGRFFF